MLLLMWAVFGSYNSIGLSYGPIGIILLLGFCGGGKKGSQNMGVMEAICGGQQQ
jgi:hypothetical protein